MVAVTVAFVAAVVFARHGIHVAVYGAVVFSLLAAKLCLSLLPARAYPDVRDGLHVGLVVPVYQEDPDLFLTCLASIGAQSRRPDLMIIVDDGSPDPAALHVAHEWARTRPWVYVIAQPTNRGKREALAEAFRASEVDVWVAVDSDTHLEPEAVRNLLKPFQDPTVLAATGTVLASNPHRGVLAALIDLRYVNGFLYERAAYSRLGAVLCCCGSLAAYRASVAWGHVDEFVGQTFLGRRQVFGDDRHLTNLALRDGGKVVLARDAVALTAVPERLGHFLRQQVRWGKSFFRESLWALRELSPRRVAWWLTLVEVGTWVAFTLALLAVVIIRPALTGELHVADYLLAVTAVGYARSVHALSVSRPDWPRRWQVAAFLAAPVYGGLHLLVLLPLRVWSLATLMQGGWGTRARVEVTATPPAPVDASVGRLLH